MVTLTQIRKNSKRVLGMNERSIEYIRPNNLRRAIKIADNKVTTKVVLKKHGIPVPETIDVIRTYDDIEKTDFANLPKSFVIKPVHGVRGGGVEIFYNRDKDDNFIQSDGGRRSVKDLESLCRDIIDGRYSLNNEADTVLIEERVKPHKIFRYHTYKGTPDVRIIVFNSIPVMGMLRLPTQKSKGKANLDQGAIGTGIDMAVGKTTTAIYGKSGSIEKVPHTKIPVSGLKIPYWDRILRYAVEASQVTKLGYAAIDFLIDKENGPVVVEINARAGLSIQIANNTGLRARLKKAGDIKVKSIKQAIRLCKDMFGGEIEEEIESISGKEVISLIEDVELFSLDEKTSVLVKAKIDTGADRTSVDKELMKELGYNDAICYFNAFNYPIFQSSEEARNVSKEREEQIEAGKIEEHPLIKSRVVVKSGSGVTLRPILPLKFKVSDTIIETTITALDRAELKYKMIIGRSDLMKFLIDPARKMNK